MSSFNKKLLIFGKTITEFASLKKKLEEEMDEALKELGRAILRARIEGYNMTLPDDIEVVVADMAPVYSLLFPGHKKPARRKTKKAHKVEKEKDKNDTASPSSAFASPLGA